MISENEQTVFASQSLKVVETRKGEAKKTPAYSAPRIFEIGKAVDLLQGIGGSLIDSYASNYRE